MTPGDRLARLDDLERGVRATLDGNPEPAVKLQALQHLRQLAELRSQAQTLAIRTDPITRARAREARPDDEARGQDGLHRLRKGRDQCSAHRRDGSQCEAPAVPWTLVCRRHGGSAPQVLIKARRFELLAAHHDAAIGYDEAKGTPGEFDALCKWGHADRELREYEGKLDRLAELRAQLRRIKAGQEPPDIEG